MFLDPQLGSIVRLTLFVTGMAVLLASVLGIPLGVTLGLSSWRGKRWLAAIIFAGMGLPPVVVGLAVYLLLSRSGPLGSLQWLFTPQAMILAQALIALPVIMSITMSAVESVPRELVQQVRSLGACPWQARWTILREAQSGVIVAVAAGFGRVLSEVGAAMMVGGNIQGHTRVLTTAILLETGKGEFALALALGGWLMTLALLANLLLMRLQRRVWT